MQNEFKCQHPGAVGALGTALSKQHTLYLDKSLFLSMTLNK